MVANTTKKLAGVIVALLASSSMVAAVEIARQDDGWHVNGKSYAAVVDDQGNFRSLVIDGKEFLAQRETEGAVKIGGNFPGAKPAASVERDGDTVAARRDDVLVTYTFDDGGFTLQTEGGSVCWFLSEAVTACAAGSPRWPLPAENCAFRPSAKAGRFVRKVIAEGAALSLDQPYQISRGRLCPHKEEDGFQCRWSCGVDVEALELVNASLKAVGKDHRFTPLYEAGERPEFRITLSSLASKDASGELSFEVFDQPLHGEPVLKKKIPATVEASGQVVLSVEAPLEEPGLYWVKAVPFTGAEPSRRKRLGIIYDSNNYRPPLTRPDDFAAFWQEQLKKMRSIPFEPKLAENDDYAIESYTSYDLEINGHDGKRLACVLAMPNDPEPHDAEVGGWRGEASSVRRRLTKGSGQPVGVGMWQRGARRIFVGAPLPEESTYQSWNGRDDNNMLHSYLRMVRLADYLRSRDDVEHIWLFGASRTGASMLAAAALAPEQVAAVNVHVPTCCGISWADPPYHGWGRAPSRDVEGLRTAAYFDPVNFAPDLKVPVVMDGGIYDGLAPAAGIVAFHNHATKAPFRRVAIEQGAHGYFPPDDRKRMEADLAEHLESRGIEPKKREK
jgi:cephalosporin-C deacetylase-like acetyl esterase